MLNYDIVNYPDFINIIITSITLLFTTFIAAFFRHKIFDYFNIIGTFCSITVGVIIPGMIYIKGNDYFICHYKNLLTIVFILIVSSIGLCTIYCTIKKMYHIKIQLQIFDKLMKKLK